MTAQGKGADGEAADRAPAGSRGSAASRRPDEEKFGTYYLGAVSDLARSQQAASPQEILRQVFQSLAEQGYNPLDQLVGYLLSGDPAFITSHGDARTLVSQVGRDELLEELVRGFFEEGDP